MPIAVDIDVMPAKRTMFVGELADRVGITPANLAVTCGLVEFTRASDEMPVGSNYG